jgi:hypothetical protein
MRSTRPIDTPHEPHGFPFVDWHVLHRSLTVVRAAACVAPRLPKCLSQCAHIGFFDFTLKECLNSSNTYLKSVIIGTSKTASTILNDAFCIAKNGLQDCIFLECRPRVKLFFKKIGMASHPEKIKNNLFAGTKMCFNQ